jgi:phosphoglycolate phosphatase
MNRINQPDKGEPMRLADLENFNPITIQCHNNPDADTIASGYALYTYFQDRGKEVSLIYSGRDRIQKSNLVLMIDRLHIPITYLDDTASPLPGLLITVDCQYGAGNVVRLEAEQVAVIDHHQVEITDIPLSEIRSNLGSCSTLIWQMMLEEGYSLLGKTALGTALYYGLYSDTNQFSEIYNPVDMDMRDSLPCEKSLINLFRNSNLSLQELEIAGIALIRHIYNDDYRFAIVKSYPCDPNILGLISDFLLQVDSIDTCVVYHETEAGLKFSVRSCIKEVKANELASFLAEGVGSGGGHMEKAGGFIPKQRYEEKYPVTHSESFFGGRMTDYYSSCSIIDAQTYEIDIANMQTYIKKRMPQGYAVAKDVLPVGTPITIRTLEGDADMTVEEDLIIMIGIKGEVYPSREEKFVKNYHISEEKYSDLLKRTRTEYIPTIRNRIDGSVKEITAYAGVCMPKGETCIYARELTGIVKVFTAWDQEKYMLGRPGDYLAVRCDDLHDIYVVERGIFGQTYRSGEDRRL